MTNLGGQRRVIIAGGSVGGLFLGNLLVRSGWQVDIFERASEALLERGAGIAGHSELDPILKTILGSDADFDRIYVAQRFAIDHTGRVVAQHSFPQYLTSWNVLFGRIRNAFPAASYHLGIEVLDVVQGEHEATVSLSNGCSLSADVVVGADGIRSRIRSKLAPDIVPRYAQYVAWRGIVDDPIKLDADLVARFSFCFPKGGQLIGYPLLGRDGQRGRRRYNFLWYYRVPEGRDFDDLLTDEDGRRHEYSIPPPSIRREHIDAFLRTARERLPQQFCDAAMCANQFMIQPIYDVQSKQISFGRAALLGDAAFVARPHVGIGVLKAALDAVSLTQCLDRSESVPGALRGYENERLQPGLDAVQFGRRLGAFIERGLDGPTSDPDLGLSYEFILRESARLPRPSLAGEASTTVH